MTNVIDYKKEYKDLYQPKTTPTVVDVEEMLFAAVEGKGNPNDENGDYQKAIEVLYGIQYTMKGCAYNAYISVRLTMSRKP